ncbi:MAG: ABC transporter permease [Microbacterium sp.]
MSGWIAIGVLVIVLIVSVFGRDILPFHPNEQGQGVPYGEPSAAHPFGLDALGRDILSRVVDAGRISFPVAFGSVFIAASAGTVIGLVSGYFRGWIDVVFSRAMDVVFAFPALLLAIVIMAIAGPSMPNAILAVGIVYTPRFARVARGEVLSVREKEYVDAARLGQVPTPVILFRHILPNVASPLITLVALSMSTSLLTYSALSFLGMGVAAPQADFGSMLAQSVGSMVFAPWLMVYPAIGLVVLICAFNVLGDAIRKRFDDRGT